MYTLGLELGITGIEVNTMGTIQLSMGHCYVHFAFIFTLMVRVNVRVVVC